MKKKLNELINNCIESFKSQDQAALKSKTLKSSSISSWRLWKTTQVGFGGFMSGITGGPIGIAVMLPEFYFTFQVAAEAAYGIGHLLGREPEEEDWLLILGIAFDKELFATAKEVQELYGKKIWIKTKTKELLIGSSVIESGIKVIQSGTVKVAKVLPKTSVKSGTKLGQKIATKVSTKSSAKIGTKMATKSASKWIPVIGGVFSSGINYWLINLIMDAAEEYYRSEFIGLPPELAAA